MENQKFLGNHEERMVAAVVLGLHEGYVCYACFAILSCLALMLWLALSYLRSHANAQIFPEI